MGQTELLNMWDKPYHTVTTTMLWNAASDDAGSDNSANNDDTEFDTYGNTASLSDNSDSSWGTHSYSSDDNGGIAMPDTSVHSWDSSDSVNLKQQLKHMFKKGINRVTKEIAAKVCPPLYVHVCVGVSKS